MCNLLYDIMLHYKTLRKIRYRGQHEEALHISQRLGILHMKKNNKCNLQKHIKYKKFTLILKNREEMLLNTVGNSVSTPYSEYP